MNMQTRVRSSTRLPLVLTAVVLAGLQYAGTASADSLYQADRSYCESRDAQESKALCLKEAAAAQADRQRGFPRSRVSEKHQAATPAAESSKESINERAHEAAQKTRGFTHRQLQKARHYSAEHPAEPAATHEPNKEPAALGK